MVENKAMVGATATSTRVCSCGYRANTMYLLLNTNFILTIGERPMDRQELIDEAIKVTKDTIMFCDDWTALDKLMAFVPTERLKEFLPVEEQDDED